jgi:hypothetical protein
MTSGSSSDVDLLFVALHQASLQCSQKSFMRYVSKRTLEKMFIGIFVN